MENHEQPIYLQVLKAMMQFKALTRKLPPPSHEVSHLEFMTLKHMEEYEELHPDHPGIRPSELSELSGLSRSAVSQHINMMEEHGLISRINSKKDRRATYLTFTDKSREMLARGQEHFNHTIERYCNLLGEEKCRQLVEIISLSADIFLQINGEDFSKEGENH